MQRKLGPLFPLSRCFFMGKKGDVPVKATGMCVRKGQEPHSVVVNSTDQIVHLVEQCGTHILIYKLQIYKMYILPWLVWLSGLSAGLQTRGLPVRFPVRAYA